MRSTSPAAKARRRTSLLSRLAVLLLIAGVCTFVPSQAAVAKTPVRQITQLKAVGIPGTTGTTVALSARIKNTSDKRRVAAHARMFLVGDKQAFPLGKTRVPAIAHKGHVKVKVQQMASRRAPAGRYAVRVCFVAKHPGHCRTSSRTVLIAPSRLAATTPSLSFADTVQGTSSPAKQVRITNTGQTRTSVLDTSVDNKTSFALSTTCRTLLAPGAACTVDVKFTPGATGRATGTLRIADRSGGTVSVALDGTGTSPAPEPEPAALSITPGEVDFAATAVGDSTASQTITVSNDGDLASGTPTVSLTGDDDQFDVTADTCTTALTGGESCTVEVIFAPTAAEQSSAVLTVAATPGGEAAADLTGTGQTPPALSISQSSYNYGYSDAPTEHVFTISNTGDAVTGVPATTLTGNAAFSVTSNACTAVLTGASSCAIGVTYTGTGTAEQSAQLEVAAVAGGTVSADLTGSPVALSITPAAHDFGGVDVDSTSDEASFALTNHRLTSVQVEEQTSGPFSAADTCDAVTLDAGATCNFTAQFSPTAAGAASGHIAYESGSDTAQADLTGDGLTPAQLSISSSVNDFGAYAVGGSPGTSELTITNTGTKSSGDVTLALQGGVDDFTVASTDCTTVLAGGASCTATVEFTPLSNGDKTATVTANGAPSNSVTLIGLGAPEGISMVPATFDFGSVAVGDSTVKTFRVINTTETTEDLNTVSTTTPLHLEVDSDFTCVLQIIQIAPHRWCTVTLGFRPQAAGPFSTTLTASGPNLSTTANLTGTGVAARASRGNTGGSHEAGPWKLELKDGNPVVSR